MNINSVALQMETIHFDRIHNGDSGWGMGGGGSMC